MSEITGDTSYTLAFGDTSFTPHDTTWNVENVEAALNNLNLRENQLDTHYSTDEQIVGRWIDGKPVYQKIIESTTSSVGAWTGIDISNLSIGEMVDFRY